MSPETAQQLFSAIFSSLQENNFQDVGAFLSTQQNEPDIQNDSQTALQELYQKAQDTQRSVQALRMLLTAMSEYFGTAQRLPASYEKLTSQISALTGSKIPPELIIANSSEERINVGEVLNNTDVVTLIWLTQMTREFISFPDNEFFERLNNSL